MCPECRAELVYIGVKYSSKPKLLFKCPICFKVFVVEL